MLRSTQRNGASTQRNGALSKMEDPMVQNAPLVAAMLGLALPVGYSAPGEGRSDIVDCLMSIAPENNTGGPVITDRGSSTGTNGAGCDGCKVDTVRIKVTWAHSLGALVYGMNGRFSAQTTAGKSDTYEWKAGVNIECDGSDSVVVSEITPVGEEGDAALRFNCEACQ